MTAPAEVAEDSGTTTFAPRYTLPHTRANNQLRLLSDGQITAQKQLCITFQPSYSRVVLQLHRTRLKEALTCLFTVGHLRRRSCQTSTHPLRLPALRLSPPMASSVFHLPLTDPPLRRKTTSSKSPQILHHSASHTYFCLLGVRLDSFCRVPKNYGWDSSQGAHRILLVDKAAADPHHALVVLPEGSASLFASSQANRNLSNHLPTTLDNFRVHTEETTRASHHGYAATTDASPSVNRALPP